MRSSLVLIFLACIVFLGAECSRPGPVRPPMGDAGAPSEMPLFAHPGSCRQCHSSPEGSGVPDFEAEKTSCSTSGCHAPLVRDPAVLHAPLRTGDCRLCHAQHSSAHPRLLVREEKRLCYGCHERLYTCPAADRSLTAACSACHDAHGAQDRFLLRHAVHGVSDSSPLTFRPGQTAGEWPSSN